ncbi:MAG: 3-isopropylmalate dehydratase large subunit [Planctomycetes bacterium]|nr:3-isopropylmalate dehydratase large subunit [Planctomycetota bacterium]
MGKTFAEKIIGIKVGREVSAGEIVVVKPDICLSHDNTAAILSTFKELGVEKLENSDRHVIILDHTVPAPTEKNAQNHQKIREFVKEQGIQHFYDINAGICHQVLPEKGHVLPGTLIVGSDSHTTTHGAFNAFSCGIGRSEAAVIMGTGEIWLRVPETLRIIITGRMQDYVTTKDVALYIIGKIRADGADYKSVQFEGETVDRMSMADRITLCNMAAEMGAKNGYCRFDDKTQKFLKNRVNADFTPVWSDEDAEYSKTHAFDAGAISLQIAEPNTVDNVIDLSEKAGIKINQALLGTCTNGRLEDFHAARKILKGRRIHPDVRFLVLPASYEILREAISDGTITDLIDAGAVILNPGCGPCLGAHEGVMAPGEVTISTANRNFKGRMGCKDAQIYLASPYVVAASAIAGQITHPANL